MLLVLPLCLLLASAYAQLPRPCESPKQWESRFFRRDHEQNFYEMAKLSYDETQRRIRELEDMAIGSTRDYYDVLRLYQQGVEYRLNLRTKQCNRTSLTRPFVPFGIPSNATFRYEATLGVSGNPDEEVTAVTFDGKIEGVDYYGVVSVPDCYPISNGFFTNSTGFVHTSFFDVTPGIKDPSIFTPPTECTKS